MIRHRPTHSILELSRQLRGEIARLTLSLSSRLDTMARRDPAASLSPPARSAMGRHLLFGRIFRPHGRAPISLSAGRWLWWLGVAARAIAVLRGLMKSAREARRTTSPIYCRFVRPPSTSRGASRSHAHTLEPLGLTRSSRAQIWAVEQALGVYGALYYRLAG